ncbi:MAG: 2-amino-4-hydroxy-6-hydroxymethyldihydropteridine diphosphokinase [Bacteroidales bacterium]|jgi:2-amino-4-hydroxy-6-hydroxymethyldihydropteridine diphosphokinase|nr:2-amino-4-hydroxy-6-hydroxymethyldihydropteridine diphosphokinase [Bacteroidales bacterium]MDD4670734.1 2-amino-4-hydroxy-6-hydroxymethyldihydropteridine diphosphokinase [Bacteroidales bacterium]
MIVLTLGTNLGNRSNNLIIAREKLSRRIGAEVEIEYSEILETKAIGFNGNDFLNQIAAFESNIEPEKMLDICQSIEIEMGRKKHVAQYDKYGNRIFENRIIDIDILLYNDCTIKSDRLTVPHPQVYQRPFIIELFNTLPQETRNRINI